LRGRLASGATATDRGLPGRGPGAGEGGAIARAGDARARIPQEPRRAADAPGVSGAVPRARDLARRDAPADSAPRPGPPPPPAATRGEPDTERDLLYGILAVQMGFLSLEALAEGLQARARDESGTLGQILVGRGALSGPQRDLLETMVRERLPAPGEDSTRSFGGVGAAGTIPEGRDRIPGDDLHAGQG